MVCSGRFGGGILSGIARVGFSPSASLPRDAERDLTRTPLRYLETIGGGAAWRKAKKKKGNLGAPEVGNNPLVSPDPPLILELEPS